MSPVYLFILLASLGGMVLIDRRWRLSFWRDARRAAITVGTATLLLLLTDVLGIALGVFHRSVTWAMTGALLAPELPLEEPFFLLFLAYLSLNLLNGLGRRRTRAER